MTGNADRAAPLDTIHDHLAEALKLLEASGLDPDDTVSARSMIDSVMRDVRRLIKEAK